MLEYIFVLESLENIEISIVIYQQLSAVLAVCVVWSQLFRTTFQLHLFVPSKNMVDISNANMVIVEVLALPHSCCLLACSVRTLHSFAIVHVE